MNLAKDIKVSHNTKKAVFLEEEWLFWSVKHVDKWSLQENNSVLG